VNWCTNAFANEDFTPASEFVPEDTVFLTNYGSVCQSVNETCGDVTTRVGEIGVGKQTIFFPLDKTIFFDWTDDYLLGLCANTSEEVEAMRYEDANSDVAYMTSQENTAFLLYTIDGVNKTPFFLYDNRTYFLQGCSDNRTTEMYFSCAGKTGDSCDLEPFQKFNGLDAYPAFGWWGNDTREWVDGEQHTYEFGLTGPNNCFRAKYILTAKEECAGILGISFCPLLWLRRLFRLLLSLL
jgi:hypothetical protein